MFTRGTVCALSVRSKQLECHSTDRHAFRWMPDLNWSVTLYTVETAQRQDRLQQWHRKIAQTKRYSRNANSPWRMCSPGMDPVGRRTRPRTSL